MKLFYTLFFAFLCFYSVSSQSENKQEFKQEFGINATSFFNLFLSFNDNQAGLNSYLLTYKKFNKDGKILRLGGNFRGFSNTNNPDDGSSNFDKRTSRLIDLDFRVGTERQFPIHNRWSINAGFDGITGYRYESINTDDNKVNSNSFYVGLGPIAGFQFMINDRVGLLTEASFYLTFFSSIEKTKPDGSFTDDTTDKQSNIGVGTTLPSNVIFFVRF